MKQIVTLGFICCSLLAGAQQWTWDSIVSSHSHDELVSDHQQTVYAYRPNGNDLVKYNASGKIRWHVFFDGNLVIKQIRCGNSNTFFLAGLFANTLTIGNQTLTSHGGADLVFVKLDSNANVVWVHQVGSRGEDGAGDITAGAGGKLFITGGTRDSTWFDAVVFPKEPYLDMFVARCDSGGNLEAVKFAVQLNSSQYSGSVGTEIKTDHAGHLVLMAGFTGHIQYDTAVVNDGYSYYVFKLDTGLKVIWKKYVTAGLGVDAGSLEINNDNGILYLVNVSGHYFDYGAVQRMSPDGSGVQNFFTENMGHLHGLDLDPSGSIYFTGYRDRWTYSGNPPDEYFFKTGQLSSTGQLNWLLQDSSLHPRTGYDIAWMSGNKCLVSGMFMDTIVLRHTLIAPSSGPAFFLAILDNDQTTSVNSETVKYGSLEIFPNPSNGLFTIRSGEVIPGARLCIYDAMGSCVLTISIREEEQVIDLGQVAKGIYIVKLESREAGGVKRIIIQ